MNDEYIPTEEEYIAYLRAQDKPSAMDGCVYRVGMRFFWTCAILVALYVCGQLAACSESLARIP